MDSFIVIGFCLFFKYNFRELSELFFVVLFFINFLWFLCEIRFGFCWVD